MLPLHRSPARSHARADTSAFAADTAPGAAGRRRPVIARRSIARSRPCYPSLVRVSVVYLDQQAGREVKGQLSGSGTIISTDGYVVTNHHVAGRPRRIVCTLSTREEVPADLVGTDPLSDIAVAEAAAGDAADVSGGEVRRLDAAARAASRCSRWAARSRCRSR